MGRLGDASLYVVISLMCSDQFFQLWVESEEKGSGESCRVRSDDSLSRGRASSLMSDWMIFRSDQSKCSARRDIDIRADGEERAIKNADPTLCRERARVKSGV